MSSFYAKLDEVKAYHSLKEAVDTLDCGDGRGDRRWDDDDDDDDASIGNGVSPDGGENDGDRSSSLRPRGGGSRGRAARRAARARTTPQRGGGPPATTTGATMPKREEIAEARCKENPLQPRGMVQIRLKKYK